MSQADRILRSVYSEIGIISFPDPEKYSRIHDILSNLRTKNQQLHIGASTTGTISERLCELALRGAMENRYNRLNRNWQWLGDFSLHGDPFNIIVSVKSFKARERLISSGTGSLLAPTIGWMPSDDVKEWHSDRVRSYVYAGFVAIYLPIETLRSVGERDSSALEITNLNNNRLLRPLNSFLEDLLSFQIEGVIDIRKI